MQQSPKIAIIGGGVSGISAGIHLLKHGFKDVTILEAENRIGGRINSVPFGECMIDLGAQWCHGEKNNAVFELVKNFNVLHTSFNSYQDNQYHESSGRIIDKSLSDKLFQIAFEIFECEDITDEKGTFGDYFVNRYNKEVVKEFGTNKECAVLAKQFLDWFHKFYLCLDSPKTWFDVAFSNNIHYQHCEGDPLLNWGREGYKKFLDLLMQHSEGIKNKIICNKKVSKIFWNDNDNFPINIKCEDDSCYNVNHVIVTVSLGVLKNSYKNLFVPELPKYKQNAIEGLSIGTVNKIFLEFPTKWWPNNTKGFSFIWTEDDRKRILIDYPHGPSENGFSWLEDVFGFYVIDNNPKVLLGWVVGKHVTDVELLSDEILMQGCMYLLDKFLGDKFTIPQPTKILSSKWYSNTNFYGSYSYRSVETENKNTSAKELARPLKSNKSKLETLLFAGEATHEKYYSTVHGAFESGHREADRIINMYKKIEKCKVAVVGAGLAGLGATKTLIEGGCENIIILEAQNRAGGRIYSFQLDNGDVIELGAQWIHGSDNEIYKLAQDNDLISDEISDEGIGMYVRDDGLIFDEMLVKYVDFEIGKILEECEKFVDCNNHPKSVGDFLEKKFTEYTNNDDDIVKQMKWELYDWHVRFQIIDNSCTSLKKLSTKHWGKYICTNGEQAHINLKHGYQTLIDILIKSLPHNILKLQTPVTKIEYNDNNLLLTCKNNMQIIADHLIYTPSIGVLKNSLNIFSPPLPKNLSNSINSMGFYGISKIFLIFESKWWKFKGLQLLWRKNTILDDKISWIRHITGFDVINNSNVLLGWVGGEGVKIMENLSESEISEHCVILLEKFLNCDVPQPIKVIRSNWLSCPWVLGAYSHFTVECDSVENFSLSEPVVFNSIPRILLAGEAIHQTHFSTTHGAFESGQEQAKKLLKYFNCTKK